MRVTAGERQLKSFREKSFISRTRFNVLSPRALRDTRDDEIGPGKWSYVMLRPMNVSVKSSERGMTDGTGLC